MQLDQCIQAAVLSCGENIPALHPEHNLSFVALPSKTTKSPALQVDQSEHEAVFSSAENVPVSHAEHDLSLDEVPLAAT